MFSPEFDDRRCVSSCRSTTMNCFGSSNFGSFKLYAFTFSWSANPPSHCEIYCHMSSRINSQYVLQPSILQEFSTQCNLSQLSPLECPVFELHDLLPCGEILEVDMWPNQAGDMCHVLTNTPILHMCKTY
jgi:hypothetical protein